MSRGNLSTCHAVEIARRIGTRRLIAIGTTLVVALILPPLSVKSAFWGLVLLVMVVLVTWAVATRTPVLRRVFVALSSVLFVIASVEMVLREVRRPATRPPRRPATHFMSDVGYCAAPSQALRSKLVVDKKTVYDVRYTIDASGLRVTFPAGPDPAATLICFGGSYTFGEGVDDRDAMPYRVGTQSNGRVKVYNFAYPAWGPHQTLALLESGRVRRVVEPEGRVVAVYFALSDHANRCAGRPPNATVGPRYVLDPDAGVRRNGMLRDRFRLLRWYPNISRSELYRRLVLDRSGPHSPDPGLMAAILQAARRRFDAVFPGGAFHVVIWPDDRTGELRANLDSQGFYGHVGTEELRVDLEKRGLPVQVLKLPPGEITLDGDPHPDPRGQAASAAFVLREILGMG